MVLPGISRPKVRISGKCSGDNLNMHIIMTHEDVLIRLNTVRVSVTKL